MSGVSCQWVARIRPSVALTRFFRDPSNSGAAKRGNTSLDYRAHTNRRDRGQAGVEAVERVHSRGVLRFGNPGTQGLHPSHRDLGGSRVLGDRPNDGFASSRAAHHSAARAWRRALSLTDCILAGRFQHSPVHSPKYVRNSITRRAGECCIRPRQRVAKTSYERIPTQTGRANVRANVGNLKKN